ncbi:hypothetical protein Tco_0237722 [Tanacetum coccineum]
MTVKGKSKAICDVRGNLIPKFIPWNMVKMHRPETSQLCDFRDTRGTLQHALRSLISCDKSNVVGILLPDNAHRRPNADQSMSGVSSALTHTASPKNKAEVNHIAMWIEAKTVAGITGKQVMKFVWDNIVCRFGLSWEIISDNEKQLLLNLDLLEEKRELAAIAEEKHKRKMEKYYNLTVWSIVLKPRDLVYHSNEAIKKEDTRKLGPKWEGPYEVIETLGDKAYFAKRILSSK